MRTNTTPVPASNNSTTEAPSSTFDFDLTDASDAANADTVRALVFDLPSRPGTLR